MPQAVAAAAAWAANVVSSAVYAAATYVGFSAATAATISMYAASITAAAVATLAYVGPGLLFRPNVPSPEVARQIRRQPVPDRLSGYGRGRLGGAVMLWEVVGPNAYTVLAMHDGLMDGWEELYLHDNVEEVVGGFVQTREDLRYGKFSDLVRIDMRLGLPAETVFADVTAEAGAYWPAEATGDGIAGMAMICKSGDRELHQRDYPFGLPKPSRVGRMQLCWDPRLGDRGTIEDDADKAASATWAWTENPILQLLDYMTNPNQGMGLPLSMFLPKIATWITAADVCDEPVALLGGGDEPRYRSGGSYFHRTAPADVIATILATCNGWMVQDLDGVFVIEAGKYYEPTVTITSDNIISISRQFFQEDERAVNEVVPTYTDPASGFNEIEAVAKRDEADVAARGDDILTQPLGLPWVPSGTQAQRLAKVAVLTATAPVRGTIVTDLSGLRAWSERRIRIQDPTDSEIMADIVVDCLPVTLNPDFTVTIPFIATPVTVYDWNPATDEGATSAGATRPPPLPVGIPVIDSVAVFAGSPTSARLRVTIDGALAGQSYVVRWRVTGDTVWTQEAPQTAVAVLSDAYVETGPVPAAVLDVQAASIGARGALSEWSLTTVVDASVAAADPPTAPTGVTVSSPAAGQIAADWTNSTDLNYHHTRVLRTAPGALFSTAVSIGTVVGVIGEVDSGLFGGIPTGSYDVWLVSETADLEASVTPSGPHSVAVA